ncbi:MAG TPA: rRNA maturation RNase YbeY [Mycobacteriales bacterium]|nr:rRNA maturation RNase YbeY [Mycobacteriales bacterium]
MSVEILNESGVAVDEVALAALARFVLDELGVHRMAELSIRLVDVASMERLHELWMGEPGPTDVMAFSMDELPASRGDDDESLPPVLLGDVLLCPEVADRQARHAGHSVEQEIDLLCTHGVLHLLGYDHAEAVEEQQMFAVQSELLGRWRDTRTAREPR